MCVSRGRWRSSFSTTTVSIRFFPSRRSAAWPSALSSSTCTTSWWRWRNTSRTFDAHLLEGGTSRRSEPSVLNTSQRRRISLHFHSLFLKTGVLENVNKIIIQYNTATDVYMIREGTTLWTFNLSLHMMCCCDILMINAWCVLPDYIGIS